MGATAFRCVVGTLGTTYVNYAGLTSDMWGHFQDETAGQPLVWVPNPDPGARSSAVLPPRGGFLPFPGTFFMRPLIPEPPIVTLLALALGALLVRQHGLRQ